MGWIPEYLLPSPFNILKTIYIQRKMLAVDTLITLYEIVASFLVAVTMGITLAILVVRSRIFESAIYPLLVMSQAIPKVALAPLILIWFGFGLSPKIIIGALVAFFPVLINTVSGIRSVEQDSVFLLQSMGARPSKIFLHLRLPTAMPNIFGGAKVAITLAVVGAIIAEFIGANRGLGYVLIVANGMQDMRLLFASLTLISLLAVLCYWAISAAESMVLDWHVSKRGMHGHEAA
jgi:NitT/TauT family transport system permease protein